MRVMFLEDKGGSQAYRGLAATPGMDAMLAQPGQNCVTARPRVAVDSAERAAAARAVDVLRKAVLELLKAV